MKNRRAKRWAELVAAGYNRLDSTGSAWMSFRRGTDNVDVGPRGAVKCWQVVPVGTTLDCHRISYEKAIADA